MKSARLSEDGVYRFRLSRRWSPERCVLWVMLNPSTADADNDDPTIRRCIGFAKDWGYGAINVGNLYALRATDPAELAKHHDPYGVGNCLHLREMAKESALIVAAWGAHKFVRPLHAMTVLASLRDCAPIKCLGKTKSGAPRHPLYVARDAALVDYLI